MTIDDIRVFNRGLRVALLGVALTLAVAGTAFGAAAPPDPNTGALTFTGGLDVPTQYMFRGLCRKRIPS